MNIERVTYEDTCKNESVELVNYYSILLSIPKFTAMYIGNALKPIDIIKLNYTFQSST